MKGSKVAPVIITIAAVFVVIVGGFLLLQKAEEVRAADPEQPSTAITIDKRVKPLVANTASLRDAQWVEMFGRLKVLQPPMWDGAMGEEDVVVNYADRTICSGPTARCPHILFFNLTPPDAPASYATDKLKSWVRDACKSDNPKVEGTPIVLAGQPASYYRQVCSGDEKDGDIAHAWYVPGKQLFVTADPGVAPEIIQGALEQMQ